MKRYFVVQVILLVCLSAGTNTTNAEPFGGKAFVDPSVELGAHATANIAGTPLAVPITSLEQYETQ